MNGILNPIKNKYEMDMDIIRILESFENHLNRFYEKTAFEIS